MNARAADPSERVPRERLILVSGATGYVGGRLVPRLLAAGHRVRCLVRDPSRLQGRSWLARVEVAPGDVLRPAGLADAMAGVDVAYYLIHSMAGGKGFHERDIVAAVSIVSSTSRSPVSR